MCKRLDVQNLFKANKKVAKSLQNYPFLRNSFIGHGYTYAKRSCISRKEQINKDRNLDVEHSLLLSADLNRDTKNEIEVIESYKQILNRTTSPNDVKMSAILNLASYLALKGKREEALKCFGDYNHLFSSIPSKNTEREKYALYTKTAIATEKRGSSQMMN